MTEHLNEHQTTLGKFTGCSHLLGEDVDPRLFIFESGVPNSPRILLTGMIHGDEYTAFETLSLLVQTLGERQRNDNRQHHEHKSKGNDGVASYKFPSFSYFVIPCVNVAGAVCGKRCIPYDEVDLNRSFPGGVDETVSGRLAFALGKLAGQCDVVIDVHTAGWSIPFNIIDDIADTKLLQKVRKILSFSSFLTVEDSKLSPSLFASLQSSFSAYAISIGKIALTVELPGASGVDYKGSLSGVNNLEQLFRGIEFVFWSSGVDTEENRCLIYQRREILSSGSGFFVPVSKPGDVVQPHQMIGFVRNPVSLGTECGLFAHPEEAPDSSTVTSVILALNPSTMVTSGTWLATVCELR